MFFHVTRSLFLVCAVALPAGASTMYVADSADHLLIVDVDSGQVQLVGRTLAQFTDVAFDAGGHLYGVTPTYLYEVDPTNAWSTLIGPHGFGGPGIAYGIDALTFGADGVLYAAGDDILISIDPLTGVGTRLGGISGHRSAGDLAVDSAGRLLLTTDAGALVTVDPNGGAEAVGSLPFNDVFALASDGAGNLYGIRSNNQIVTVDPQTGRATETTSLQADFLIGRAWGASFPDQVAPEPSTIVLFVLAVPFVLLARPAVRKLYEQRIVRHLHAQGGSTGHLSR